MVEPSDLPPEFLAYGIQVYVSLSGLSNLGAHRSYCTPDWSTFNSPDRIHFCCLSFGLKDAGQVLDLTLTFWPRMPRYARSQYCWHYFRKARCGLWLPVLWQLIADNTLAQQQQQQIVRQGATVTTISLITFSSLPFLISRLVTSTFDLSPQNGIANNTSRRSTCKLFELRVKARLHDTECRFNGCRSVNTIQRSSFRPTVGSQINRQLTISNTRLSIFLVKLTCLLVLKFERIVLMD